MTVSQKAPGSSRTELPLLISGSVPIGRTTSNRVPTSGPQNAAGVTPIIVNGTPPIASCVPKTVAAPWNCRCQKPWLMRRAGPAARSGRRSSSIVSVRPTVADTPPGRETVATGKQGRNRLRFPSLCQVEWQRRPRAGAVETVTALLDRAPSGVTPLCRPTCSQIISRR